MKIVPGLIIPALLVLVPAIAAHAGVLFTPPLSVGSAQHVECVIANVGSSPETVTIELFPTPPRNRQTITIMPGKTGGLEAIAPIREVYCKFTVQGSNNNVRAAIERLDMGVGGQEFAVAALPAF